MAGHYLSLTLRAVALAFVFAVWQPAAAQNRAPVGWLDATAYREISTAVPIRIRRAGVDEESRRIAQLFAVELGKRGYRVTDGGQGNALSFRFVTEVAATRDRRPPHVRLRAPADDSRNDNAIDLVPQVDDGRDPATRLQSGPRTLVVEVLDAGRRLLWSARATPLVRAESLEAIAALVVPPLLDHLGQDASGEDIYAP